jgi:hypothetical protein
VARSAIGLLRGAIIPLSVLAHPALIARYQTFDWVAAALWGSIGLCFGAGQAMGSA